MSRLAGIMTGHGMTKNDIFQLICQHAREVLPQLADHQFIETDQLALLGASSIDRAEITMMVQESMNLTIARVELFGPRNIGELASLLFAKLNAG
jgi:polyketide biosynthesis acyl carrier protein